MIRMRNSLLLIFAAAVLAGCGPAQNDNRPNLNVSSPAGQAAEQPTPAPEAAKPTPADEAATATSDFEGTAGITAKKYQIREPALFTDVRAGRHEGFDRVVFEFSGEELPGYHIEYIDKPVRSCGSGEVVTLAGDAWLQVRFEPANSHTEDGKPTLRFREVAPKLPIVLELKSTCDFEAQVEWVIGVASPNRYRVLELRSPTRLVVDIKHK